MSDSMSDSASRATGAGGGIVGVQPNIDLSEFAEFVDALRGHRADSEQLVRHALRRVGERYPERFLDEVRDISRAIDGTLGELDRAAEELRVQNEALLSARTELEGTSLLFHDLFELAPMAYVVTTPDTRILYANQEACALLLARPKNALAGKLLICFVPLEERSGFRSAVLRSASPGAISEWPATLLPSGAAATIKCRMRIRAVSASRAPGSRTLFWNMMEETDEDFF
jgi:PAS domain-containing protein